jgi:pyruvate/2-oxoglutarate/acetoin dehydrogenase E1 component
MTTTVERTDLAPAGPTHVVSTVEALRETLDHALESDPTVFIAGEDVALYGTVWGTTRGLMEKYGERRVFDTPIAEEAIIGLAVGAASTGLRPVVELMFIDFVGECMDEICNQLAKMRYMFGGKIQLPVTIRTSSGAGMNAGAQHSQSLEAWLCHIPGLKVVMPSNPYDAKGLLRASILDDDPVVFIEVKSLYASTGEVPIEAYTIPLGQAAIPRTGSDITVVATGAMVPESLLAAEALAAEGIDVEVVDPRTLVPLDIDTIVESVRRTHRALVVQEAVRFGGFGAEIASQIQELAFDELDAPVGRIGAPFSPVPFSPALEDVYVPNAARIQDEIRALCNR